MSKRYIKLLITAALTAAVFISLAIISLAAESGVYTYADPGNENTIIRTQQVDGKNYLFLPSNISQESITLYFDGETGIIEDTFGQKMEITSSESFNASFLRKSSGGWDLKLTYGDTTTEFTIMLSANINSAFITSDDPVNQGRQWVEASPDKSNKAKGTLVYLAPDGTAVYDGALTQIKGRGNSTWAQEKKPYQIKLKKSADLLGTGLVENENKTWLLIANYLDASMLRNAVTFNFASALGLDGSIEYQFTDLYYDGEYRGTYLLTEKVEVNSGRVDINDLDDANENANPDYDFDFPETVRGTTSFGTDCQYVSGLTSPEDISGGYLLEMEMENRIYEEVSWFKTKGGDYLLTKSPECACQAELEYVSTLYQQFEDAVYNGGVNPDTGKKYTQYMDLDSLVRCYLIMELSGNSECFINSTFFYLPQGSDIFYAGPIWDYDLAYCVKTTQLRAGMTNLGRELIRLTDFCEKAREIYQEEFLPVIQQSIAPGGTIDQYMDMVYSSGQMNYRLWPYTAYKAPAYGGQSLEGNVEYLKNYISQRSSYLSQIFSVLPAPFDDVSVDAWYGPYISHMYCLGFVSGTETNNFSPDSNITRCQAVTILYRMYGSETEYKPLFTDIPDNRYYSQAVVWANENGLITGYGDGRFRPDRDITREQLAVILYRASGQPESDGDLSEWADGSDVSNYARKAVAWACENGIISGSGGMLRASNAASRAECTKMLDAFYSLFPNLSL